MLNEVHCKQIIGLYLGLTKSAKKKHDEQRPLEPIDIAKKLNIDLAEVENIIVSMSERIPFRLERINSISLSSAKEANFYKKITLSYPNIKTWTKLLEKRKKRMDAKNVKKTQRK